MIRARALHIARWSKSASNAATLAGDALVSGFWMGFRLIALGFWLVMMSRLLAAADFGWLAGSLAISAVCALFSSAGIPYLFFSDVHSEDGERTALRWRHALGALCTVGVVLSALTAVVILLWTSSPVFLGLVVALVFADVVLAGVVQAGALKLHAMRQFSAAAGLPAMLTAGRAVAAVLALATESGLQGYLIAHVLAAAVVCALSMAWVKRIGRVPLWPKLPSKDTLHASSAYALMAGSSVATGELDKPVIGRLAGLTFTGHYALAYRICAAAATPATALAAAMLPRWSRLVSRRQPEALRRSVLHTLVAALAVCSVTTCLFLVFLGRVPVGSLGLYEESYALMSQLAWITVPLGVHQVAGTSLIAIGRPAMRAACELAGLGVLSILLLLSYLLSGTEYLATACIIAESVTGGSMAYAFWRASGARAQKRSEASG